MKIHPRVVQECVPKQNHTKLLSGTECHAKCNQTGYRLIGPRTRECLSMGKWTGYEQFCIGKRIVIGIESVDTFSFQWVRKQHLA